MFLKCTSKLKMFLKNFSKFQLGCCGALEQVHKIRRQGQNELDVINF